MGSIIRDFDRVGAVDRQVSDPQNLGSADGGATGRDRLSSGYPAFCDGGRYVGRQRDVDRDAERSDGGGGGRAIFHCSEVEFFWL